MQKQVRLTVPVCIKFLVLSTKTPKLYFPVQCLLLVQYFFNNKDYNFLASTLKGKIVEGKNGFVYEHIPVTEVIIMQGRPAYISLEYTRWKSMVINNTMISGMKMKAVNDRVMSMEDKS